MLTLWFKGRGEGVVYYIVKKSHRWIYVQDENGIMLLFRTVSRAYDYMKQNNLEGTVVRLGGDV